MSPQTTSRGVQNGAPHNITEAIRLFEKATSAKASELKSILGKDFEEIKKAVEDLKPYAENIKDSVVHTASQKVDESWEATKGVGRKVDEAVHENPWMSVGVVAFLALFMGYLMGRRD